jgi:hypothetical protein
MQMEQTPEDGHSVNAMDESNGWTTVSKNLQRTTSRNNNNDDSVQATTVSTHYTICKVNSVMKPNGKQ